eukprot:14779822-Ditylum_brightwellii.AAC.1
MHETNCPQPFTKKQVSNKNKTSVIFPAKISKAVMPDQETPFSAKATTAQTTTTATSTTTPISSLQLNSLGKERGEEQLETQHSTK